jgi:FKBP-type peptidyl-prolyl cis-trans isomerase
MKTLSRNEWIAVAAALVVVALFLVFSGAFSGLFAKAPAGDSMSTTTNATSTFNGNNSIPGLTIEDTLLGSGTEAKTGDVLMVHYVGTFENGTVFDSSIPRGEPFVFTLGVDPVIEGWQKGMAGMKVGGKRRLIIEPELAYGSAGVRDIIPPNSTLVFDVELLDVEAGR